MEKTKDVPFVRKKKKGEKTLKWLSPLDLQEKESIKAEMGSINFENMWKSSTNTLITNTGNFLNVELASPGVLKWKPAGDVSYTFANSKLLWAFDDYGSAHSIEGQKYAMEMVSTFKYSYEVVVPPEIIFKRIELHELYKELATTTEEGEQKIMGDLIEEKESDYNEAEDTVLDENYVHSVGKEALSHRKPTSFHIGGLKSATPISGMDDEDDSEQESELEEDTEDHKPDKQEVFNFYRLVKFRKERSAIELAAKRFYPYYATYTDRKADSENKGSIESASDLIDYLTERPLKSRIDKSSDQTIISLDDSPIDPKMFPRERDKDRERVRRAKYFEDRQKREQAETEKKLYSISNHKISISVKLSLLFEAMTATEYFSYVGARFFYPNEEVIRIVQKAPLPILSDQLWELRSLKNEFGKAMETTMPTEIQKVNGRDIFYNVPSPKIEPPTCPGKDRCMCELETETNWQAYKRI